MMLALLGSLTALIFVLFGGTIGLLCLALWIWMLVDCLTNDGIPGSEKVAWVLVIFLLPLIGSLIYLFVGRPKRKRT